MSEKLEQVARAIWEARRTFAKDQFAGICLEEWGDGSLPILNGIMEEARAAVEAMREPSKAMKDAPELGNFFGGLHIDHLYDEAAMHVWQAMIDEALE